MRLSRRQLRKIIKEEHERIKRLNESPYPRYSRGSSYGEQYIPYLIKNVQSYLKMRNREGKLKKYIRRWRDYMNLGRFTYPYVDPSEAWYDGDRDYDVLGPEYGVNDIDTNSLMEGMIWLMLEYDEDGKVYDQEGEIFKMVLASIEKFSVDALLLYTEEVEPSLDLSQRYQ